MKGVSNTIWVFVGTISTLNIYCDIEYIMKCKLIEKGQLGLIISIQCMLIWTRHFHLNYNHLKIPDKGVAGMSDGLTPLATKGLTN